MKQASVLWYSMIVRHMYWKHFERDSYHFFQFPIPRNSLFKLNLSIFAKWTTTSLYMHITTNFMLYLCSHKFKSKCQPKILQICDETKNEHVYSNKWQLRYMFFKEIKFLWKFKIFLKRSRFLRQSNSNYIVTTNLTIKLPVIFNSWPHKQHFSYLISLNIYFSWKITMLSLIKL